MNQEIKKKIPAIAKMMHDCRERYYNYLGKHCPEKLIRIWYKHIFKEEINLEAPQTINEKVNWMKLHSDYSLWTTCTDKYEVRSYVEGKGLGHVLNEIYGVYNSADEIDFDKLPNSFVLKTTNGGGGKEVLIVKDKAQLNTMDAKKCLDKWLKQRIGYRYYEPHYINISPRIIAEKYLKPINGDISLVDYKFFCFNGRVHSVGLCSDRSFNGSVHYSVYDIDWVKRTDVVYPEYVTDKQYPKPQSFDSMLEYSRKLSEGIPFVRVDWYEIDGKPVFSEMTFTPAGAFLHCFNKEYLLELGDCLDINDCIVK